MVYFIAVHRTMFPYKSIAEGSFEVKLPTTWRDGKAEVGTVREEKRREEKKKEDPGAEKSRIVAKHGVFPMICGSGGSKSRLAKAVGAIARRYSAKHISKSKRRKHTILGALLGVDMSKKCTQLWREAHFQVKM